MACVGRLDRDLVVEAMETPGPRKRRMRLMARLRRAAMVSGPLQVLSWWRSSSKTTSRIQWRRFSIPQCPRPQAATASGWASVTGREHARVDHFDTLAAFDGSGAADLDHLSRPREVHPLRGLDGLDGAPHPPTVGALDRGDGWDVLVRAEPSMYDEGSSGCPETSARSGHHARGSTGRCPPGCASRRWSPRPRLGRGAQAGP